MPGRLPGEQTGVVVAAVAVVRRGDAGVGRVPEVVLVLVVAPREEVVLDEALAGEARRDDVAQVDLSALAQSASMS